MHDDKSQSYEDFLAGIDQMHRSELRETQFLENISQIGGEESVAEELGPVGDQVKAIREEKGLTLADVASRTGFDEAFLSQVEANIVSPPLGVLIKLGKALGLKMGYFISGGESKPYTIVRAKERKRVARRASSADKAYGYTYEALAPGKTDRHMEPFIVTLEPAGEETLSSHEGQEFIFILEGHMEAILDKDRLHLGPGDAIYYDSSVPHLVRCVAGPYTKILAVLTTDDK